jgi:hypothetical protein
MILSTKTNSKMNQKYLFLSIDSYAHIKRNIFGFKNRKGVTEQRPCALAVIGSVDQMVDDVCVASFKGVKIKDDPEYVAHPIDPAYYGHPVSSWEIYERLRKLTPFEKDVVLVVYDNCREVFRDFSDKHESYIGTMYELSRGYSEFMTRQMEHIPTVYFAQAMEVNTIEGVYNLSNKQKSGSEEIPNDIKFELFQTHIRYPKFLPSDRALTTSAKMNTAYQLLCSILGKYK